jgi:hypothetical protein
VKSQLSAREREEPSEKEDEECGHGQSLRQGRIVHENGMNKGGAAIEGHCCPDVPTMAIRDEPDLAGRSQSGDGRDVKEMVAEKMRVRRTCPIARVARWGPER